MHTRRWNDVTDEEAKVKPANKKQKGDVGSKQAINGTAITRKVSKDSVPIAQKIIFDYDVDPYDHKEDVLMDGVMEILKHYDLFREFSFDKAQMRRFLNHVKLFYNPKNLFHNFKHVWGVLHLSFQILINGGDEYLFPLDIFAVVIAALCHDIQHPGNNNAFEQATASDWSKAKSYNVDAGILERHHATITHSLLNADGTDYDILVGMSAAQKEHFRRQVALIILGTDMGKHPSILAEAQAYKREESVKRSAVPAPSPIPSTTSPREEAEEGGETGKGEEAALSSSSSNGKKLNGATNGHTNHHDTHANANASHIINSKVKSPKTGHNKKFTIIEASCSQIAYEEARPARRDVVDASDPESRLAFSRVLVHTADIGAQTQCSKVALQWMNRCYGEFRSQAEREEILGIVTSPFLHDLKEDNKTFSAQHAFIEETVQPLWEAISRFLPRLAFAQDQLLQNKAGYKQMLADYLSDHHMS